MVRVRTVKIYESPLKDLKIKRKKRVSAKQLAARRKFSKIMKSGGFKRKSALARTKKRRKTPTKRRKSTTIKTSKTKRKAMVSRTKRYSRRAKSGGLRIGSSLKTGIIGEVVKGIGAGSLVGMVMGKVLPNSPLTPIVSTGAAFLAGGVTGGIAQVVLSGGLSSFGGLFGGGISAPQQEFGV